MNDDNDNIPVYIYIIYKKRNKRFGSPDTALNGKKNKNNNKFFIVHVRRVFVYLFFGGGFQKDAIHPRFKRIKHRGCRATEPYRR